MQKPWRYLHQLPIWSARHWSTHFLTVTSLISTFLSFSSADFITIENLNTVSAVIV